MKRQLAVACLLILACAPPSAARKPSGKSEPLTPEQEAPRGADSLPPEFGDFKPAALPEGKDAWAVQIVTRGGISGRGRGEVTVTSDGRVSCGAQATPCAFNQSAAALASLSQLVAAAKPSKWKSPSGGNCADCFVTLFVLQRRSGNGGAKTYTLHWDDATAAAVPAEVKQIGRAVARLAFVPTSVL